MNASNALLNEFYATINVLFSFNQHPNN